MGIDNLQDWRDALVWAQRTNQAEDPFWATDHVLASRAMPGGDSGVVGAMMVEALWESMGPLEHAWLERFVPDFRQKYPLESEWVTPRNAAIAVGHYGLTPLFNYRLINNGMGSDERMESLNETGPVWLALRQNAGLPSDCWQLTHELVLSFHSRDHLAEHLRSPYSINVEHKVMERLQTLCPSEDWPLALACAGVNSDLNAACKSGTATDAQEDAVAWLQWWLNKSPNCLDNLAWADFPKHPHYTPKTTALTQLHLDLLDNAQDPRDTFPMARALYTRQSRALESFALPSMEL